jgi:hypothetical protein
VDGLSTRWGVNALRLVFDPLVYSTNATLYDHLADYIGFATNAGMYAVVTFEQLEKPEEYMVGNVPLSSPHNAIVAPKLLMCFVLVLYV